MVNLDHIKQLEERVSKAIELLQNLKDENDVLKLELHDRQKRIDELENIVLVFRNDQAKIEEGILNALNHLSAFEDTVYHDVHTPSFYAADDAQTTPDGADAADDASDGSQSAAGKAEDSSDADPAVQPGTESQEADDANQLDIF